MPPVRTSTQGTPVQSSVRDTQTLAPAPRRVQRWLSALPPAVVLGLVLLALLLRGDARIATTLGIVQGLGEFLPISSSAHLILTPWLFGWIKPGAFYNTQWYDVALHIGTLLALAGFFWRDWIRLIRHAPQPRTENGRLFWLLVVASLPGAAIGFVLDKYAADFFRDKYLIIATTLSVMGVALYLIDTRAPQRDNLGQINWLKALVIGLAQSFAFVPGVSRSGSTMTMGRALGLRRETAARFSFLMAMPITFGAVLLKLGDINATALRLPAFWLGIVVSFVVGVLAIGFLLRYLRTNSFLPFVVYRIGLAAVVVLVYVLRR
jgi:undecaprenyl-diphosphatase